MKLRWFRQKFGKFFVLITRCQIWPAAAAAEQQADAIAKFRCRDAHLRNKCSMTLVTKVTTDILKRDPERFGALELQGRHRS